MIIKKMLNIIIKSLFLYLVFFTNVFANQDFRIRRDSPLYKGTLANRNFGALQNEDFEFTSVS